MVKPIPEGYSTITPMFIFKDARLAIDFYKKAFGATERAVWPWPDGSKGVKHAELQIGDSIVLMGEERDENNCKSAETLNGSPVSFYLYVQDADASFKRAVDAGATPRNDVQEMFWGDRMGTLTDPFGYCWALATQIKKLTPQEIKKGAEEFYFRAPEKK